MVTITAPEQQEISVRDGRNLKTAPWGHQRNAIDFLRTVFRKPVMTPERGRFSVPDGGGAYLAMGMGTGKSLVAIAMECNLAIDTCLIVTPKRVIDVWPGQFDAHAGRNDLRVIALGDDRTIAKKTEDAAFQLRVAHTHNPHHRFVVVVNYEMFWRMPFRAWALSQRWGLVIFDEIHRIKQASGKASMFAAHLRERSVYRLGLSGTPMPHGPLDIYAQYRFLQPELFGTSYTAFKARYAILGGFQQKQIVGYHDLEDLEIRARQIMFRVGKEVLDLPEELKIQKECVLSQDAARIYNSLEEEFIAEVKGGIVTAANAMVKLIRLQQVTSGFVKTDAGEQHAADTTNAKAELLEEHFEDIGAEEPIVVFCRFHYDLDTVHAIAKKTGRSSVELSGRADNLRQWQAGEANVLAVQIQSGGVGIDLTRACYSIYYSLGFNLGDYEQSLSRVHRPGQTRTVFHIHLLAKGTIDQRVMKALEKRQELVQSILNAIKGEL